MSIEKNYRKASEKVNPRLNYDDIHHPSKVENKYSSNYKDSMCSKIKAPHNKYSSESIDRRQSESESFDLQSPKFITSKDCHISDLFSSDKLLSTIITLRPKLYSEAKFIGEQYCEGNPVIMDLISIDNANAKRLVDFAAGLVFALKGSFDKIASKVFLLLPANFNISLEQKNKIIKTCSYISR